MKIKEWWMPDAQQQAFRAVLDAFARPGTQAALADPGTHALPVLLATVLDESVTLADPGQVLDADQRRLLLAPHAAAHEAHFVLLDGTAPPAAGFTPALGTLEAPELGATLVLCVPALSPQTRPDALALTLTGPGIETERMLHVGGLQRAWLERRAEWVSAYPMGVDIVLCAGQHIAALPRTTRIQLQGA
jgi:alpha-D-ribose 1-methylphosphonate 5-triphosphate synthase subunit PhnH